MSEKTKIPTLIFSARLAEILGMTRGTVQNYTANRKYHLLPRWRKIGKRCVWREEDVIAWLGRGRGRPTKAEQVRRGDVEA